ncbi:MAG TPA: MltA domain-containing protein [Caulobacteraceae bacterium]|jgi:membrane-bound lytic murein transglycosylase A
MRFRFCGLAAALLLAACAHHAPGPRPTIAATAPPRPATPSAARPERPEGRPGPTTSPPVESAPAPLAGGLAALPGWANEDHLAALAAAKAACAATGGTDPGGVCLRISWLDEPTDAQAREFMERNYRVTPAPESGVLTGYFTPVYEARRSPDAEFAAPVRPRPVDVKRGSNVHATRAQIDGWPSDDALAWMRPEDLFFLQIQGSGVLVFPEGARLRAVFDCANDQPFSGVATPMRAEGLLGTDTSGDAIHAWLASHRGPDAQAVMDLDRRYIFFQLRQDDGGPPSGAAGVRLIPGRAVAVDPSEHRMGELLWLDADAPLLPGAFPAYHRVAAALDTGSAIKGDARADLYLGEGESAGEEAGRIRHTLRLYRLEPVGPTAQ